MRTHLKEMNITMIKKLSTGKKCILIAAGILLAIIYVLYLPVLINKPEGPLLNVVYPKTYTPGDYDEWNKVRDNNPVNDDFYAAIKDFSYKTASTISG